MRLNPRSRAHRSDVKRGSRFLTLVAVLGTSCVDPTYAGLDIAAAGGDLAAPVGARDIAVREGGVVVFRAFPRSGNDKPYDGLEQVALRSQNPAIANVRRVILSDTWAITGESLGETTLRISIDGVDEDDFIRVTVVETDR